LASGVARRCKGSQSRIEVAFGVDQEGGGADHRVARLHAADDLDHAAALAPHGHRFGPEPPFAQIKDHHLPVAGVDHSTLGHLHHGCAAEHDFDLGKHVGAQAPVRVRQFNPQLSRAGHHIDFGVNGVDTARNRAIREAPKAHPNLCSYGNLHQRRFRHFGDDPDGRGVSDAEQGIARLRHHAFDRHPLQHHAAARGHDRDADRRLALGRDAVDHLSRHAEVFQSLPRALP
jgi:hypothetical protein